jgi:hypothetical protein
MSRDYNLKPFRAPLRFQIDYAKELNEQQHAAVTAPPGPALVIAGAGSGKTRTLTYRVAYLLEQGIPPEAILLLTFTNKAAKEMMRRVADLLGGDIFNLWGGTFHSVAARILRRHAPLLGFQPDFSIMDRDDAKELVQTCLAELETDPKAAGFPKADVLMDIFSLAVNKEKTVSEMIAEQFDYFTPIAPQIEALQKKYAARKKAANGMDFDDLLAMWLKLFREQDAVRQEFERRFQFILVDEYQDTNKLQGELIDLVGLHHQNVMVVGDDSQSIYSWRGAHFLNILKFPERYPKAVVYRIETNYRSTPEILNVANAAIAANINQFEKQLVAARPSGTKPALIKCADSREQAAFVAQRVLELREEGRSLKNIAVLYRSHFHALELQMELTRQNIPFSITSGIRFFEQAHVKDVAAYLKLVQNPHDELAFKRIIRLLEGVGAKSADKLWHSSAKDRFARPEKNDRGLGAIDGNHLATRSGGYAQPSIAHDQSHHGGRLRRSFEGGVFQLLEPPGGHRATGFVRAAIHQRGRISHPTGPANRARSRGLGQRDGRTGRDAPVKHSPGQGAGIRHCFSYHAVRRVVSFVTLFRDPGRRGRGAPPVLRRPDPRARRTVFELPVPEVKRMGRHRRRPAIGFAFSARNPGRLARRMEVAVVKLLLGRRGPVLTHAFALPWPEENQDRFTARSKESSCFFVCALEITMRKYPPGGPPG